MNDVKLLLLLCGIRGFDVFLAEMGSRDLEVQNGCKCWDEARPPDNVEDI